MVIVKASIDINMSEADAKALRKFLGNTSMADRKLADLDDRECNAISELHTRLREIFGD